MVIGIRYLQSWNFQKKILRCKTAPHLRTWVEVQFSGAPMIQHINLIWGTKPRSHFRSNFSRWVAVTYFSSHKLRYYRRKFQDWVFGIIGVKVSCPKQPQSHSHTLPSLYYAVEWYIRFNQPLDANIPVVRRNTLLWLWTSHTRLTACEYIVCFGQKCLHLSYKANEIVRKSLDLQLSFSVSMNFFLFPQ